MEQLRLMWRDADHKAGLAAQQRDALQAQLNRATSEALLHARATRTPTRTPLGSPLARVSGPVQMRASYLTSCNVMTHACCGSCDKSGLLHACTCHLQDTFDQHRSDIAASAFASAILLDVASEARGVQACRSTWTCLSPAC